MLLATSSCSADNGTPDAGLVPPPLDSDVLTYTADLEVIAVTQVKANGSDQVVQVGDVELVLPAGALEVGTDVTMALLAEAVPSAIADQRASVLPGPVLLEAGGDLRRPVQLRVPARATSDQSSATLISFDGLRIGWTVQDAELVDGYLVAELNEFSVKDFFWRLADATAYGAFRLLGGRYAGSVSCPGEPPEWVDRFITQADQEPDPRFPQAPVLACVSGDEEMLRVSLVNNRAYMQTVRLPADARPAAVNWTSLLRVNDGNASQTLRDFVSGYIARRSLKGDGQLILAPLSRVELEVPRRRVTLAQATQVANTGDWLAPGIYRQTVTGSDVSPTFVLGSMMVNELLGLALSESLKSATKDDQGLQSVINALGPVVECAAGVLLFGDASDEVAVAGEIVRCFTTFLEGASGDEIVGDGLQRLSPESVFGQALANPGARLSIYRSVFTAASAATDALAGDAIAADLFLFAQRLSENDQQAPELEGGQLTEIIGIKSQLNYRSTYFREGEPDQGFASDLTVVDARISDGGLQLRVAGSVQVDSNQFYCEIADESGMAFALVPEEVAVVDFLREYHHIKGGPGGPPPTFAQAIGIFEIRGQNVYDEWLVDGICDGRVFFLTEISFRGTEWVSLLTPSGDSLYSSSAAGERMVLYAVAPNWAGCLADCALQSVWAEGSVWVDSVEVQSFTLPGLPPGN